MSSVPPPPPFNSPPQPPGWNQPPAAPPAYDLGVGVGGKPPRPKVQVGAILTMVGGLLLIIGAVLPWLKIRGETGNGFDQFIFENTDGTRELVDSPGSSWVVFGVILIGLGLALFFAGRVLAVAIIAIVMAAIAVFLVIFGFGAASDTKDFAGDGSIGVGLFVGVLAVASGLAGSIAATAKRRR